MPDILPFPRADKSRRQVKHLPVSARVASDPQPYRRTSHPLQRRSRRRILGLLRGPDTRTARAAWQVRHLPEVRRPNHPHLRFPRRVRTDPEATETFHLSELALNFPERGPDSFVRAFSWRGAVRCWRKIP